MSRYDYDDMPSSDRRRRQKGSKGTFLGVSIVVLLVLISLVVYLIATSPKEEPQVELPFAAEVTDNDTDLIDFSVPATAEVEETVESADENVGLSETNETEEIDSAVIEEIPEEIEEVEEVIEAEVIAEESEEIVPVEEETLQDESVVLEEEENESEPSFEETSMEEPEVSMEGESEILLEETEVSPEEEPDFDFEISEESFDGETETVVEEEPVEATEEELIEESSMDTNVAETTDKAEESMDVVFEESDSETDEILPEEVDETTNEIALEEQEETEIPEEMEEPQPVDEEPEEPVAEESFLEEPEEHVLEEEPEEVVVEEEVIVLPPTYVLLSDNVIKGGNGTYEEEFLRVRSTPGQVVLSIGEGTVQTTGKTEGEKTLTILLDDDTTVVYEGFERVLVKVGQSVVKGTRLGSVGSSSKFGPEIRVRIFDAEGNLIQIVPE